MLKLKYEDLILKFLKARESQGALNLNYIAKRIGTNRNNIIPSVENIWRKGKIEIIDGKLVKLYEENIQ